MEAADGMEAVDKARKEDFDIIILDIMMPRLDGFSACKEIRKTRILLCLCFQLEEKNMISFSDLK